MLTEEDLRAVDGVIARFEADTTSDWTTLLHALKELRLQEKIESAEIRS